MEDTREAIVTSRTIDEQTDQITHLTEVIAQCEKTIEELIAEIKKTKEELEKATRLRKDENLLGSKLTRMTRRQQRQLRLRSKFWKVFTKTMASSSHKKPSSQSRAWLPAKLLPHRHQLGKATMEARLANHRALLPSWRWSMKISRKIGLMPKQMRMLPKRSFKPSRKTRRTI